MPHPPTAARLSVDIPAARAPCACTPATAFVCNWFFCGKGSHGRPSSSAACPHPRNLLPSLQRPQPTPMSAPHQRHGASWPGHGTATLSAGYRLSSLFSSLSSLFSGRPQNSPGGSHKPFLFHSVSHNGVTCAAWP